MPNYKLKSMLKHLTLIGQGNLGLAWKGNVLQWEKVKFDIENYVINNPIVD
jgi:hypothetical protein